MALIRRHAAHVVDELLAGFRVVVLGGARQTGKTTLAREFLDLNTQAVYSFDDPATLARAIADPTGFVEDLPRPAIIDEYQRAGAPFLLAVKAAVDASNRRGQFLLTGSTSYLADRGIAETLAGRAGRLDLWPLSAGEIAGARETFLDHIFDPAGWPGPRPAATTRTQVVADLRRGGFPEIVVTDPTERMRRRWFESYASDVVSREALRPLADIRLEAELRIVLRLLGARCGGELVISDIASDAGVSRATASDYVTLLEALHLVVLIPGWATSATTRAKKRPKILLVDTGLASDLLGAGDSDFGPRADGRTAGALFENYVLVEAHKQASWNDRSLDLFHFRDRNGAEVDLIVQDRRTREVAGVEIKFSSTPMARDARHLSLLRDRLGDRFRTGIVLHTGDRALPLGDRLWAVPVSALWRTD